jgi:protein-S-isoprenylcysteine O-methyltransferase Ste14
LISSLIVLASLAVFWGVSLRNVLGNRGTKVGRDEGENPLSPSFTIALAGTLMMFAESLVFAYLEIFGTIFYALGALLHAWSVIVRGRHAVSWAMSPEHRLITAPPYSLVRHPSYLGYMLMIAGMTLIWGNAVTLIAWVAIPGYYFVSFYEEAILLEKFGEEYRRYMDKVGAFIPKIAGPREAQEEK